MVNRILIRIKVVQMLYSYLLVESGFSLAEKPLQPTKEKAFAYDLYQDMLYLMVRVSEVISRRGGSRPLYDTRFITLVRSEAAMHALAAKYKGGAFPFESLVGPISDKVKNSALYKKFLKSDDPGSRGDEMIWQDLFKTIFVPDEGVARIAQGMENYSLSGVDRMREMIDETFKRFFASSDNLPDALNTLRRSLDKARELYFRLLWLPVRLTRLRERDLEEASRKYLATAEDRNPNLRFVENELTAAIRGSETIQKAVESYGIQLNIYDEPMLRSILKAIMESELYKEYMEFPATDFKTDCEFWRNAFRDIILSNDALLEALEDKSVFWNDDIDIEGDFVLKTIKRIADGKNVEEALMPMYKDEEDARFGAELFTAAVKGKERYRKMIDENLNKEKWDTGRLAYMDVVILIAAMAEIENFPNIPTKVSINEYVELAKCYSTNKSGTFVNGVLSVLLKDTDLGAKWHKEGE